MRTSYGSVWMMLLASLAMASTPGRGARREDVPDARYRALAEEPQFAAVGLILKDGEPNASGVLVRPQWVLTAGHEVREVTPEALGFSLSEATFGITQIVIYPGYQAGVLGHHGDLALLRLDRAVTTVPPAAIYYGTAELGAVGTTVGYGRSGAGASIITDPTPVGTKRAGRNVIDGIGGTFDDRTVPDNLLVADFDHPSEPSLNRTGDAAPLDLEYCPVGGDSGGGLFIKDDNAWYLAGLVSAFTLKVNDDLALGIHGSLMYWTRMSLYARWVDEVAGG